MTLHQAEIILALAENDLNMKAAGRAMFFHRNTIKYQVDKIKLETGLDPRKFYDMCELLPMARDTVYVHEHTHTHKHKREDK